MTSSDAGVEASGAADSTEETEGLAACWLPLLGLSVAPPQVNRAGPGMVYSVAAIR